MGRSAKLGQNFLCDEGFARRIVELVPFGSGPLLEIGAGKGILSEQLIEKFPSRRIVLVEVDALLITDLERRFSERAEVLAGDILGTDLASLFPDEKATVVGNLPYHISKPLIDWFIAQRRKIGEAALMLQKDFIDKLLSPCESKKYNGQSVAFQLLFQARRCFHVPAKAFAPKPKVVSTVIVVRPIEPPQPDVEEFYAFVKLCFAGRRKTLRNNLSAHYDASVLSAAFTAAGIPMRTRAEQLPPQRFVALWNTLKKGRAAR